MYLFLQPLVTNEKVTDPNAISYVHKDSVVGFGDYDYDYHDDDKETKIEQQESKDDTETYSGATKSSKIKDEKVLKDDFSFFLGNVRDIFGDIEFLLLCFWNFNYVSNDQILNSSEYLSIWLSIPSWRQSWKPN